MNLPYVDLRQFLQETLVIMAEDNELDNKSIDYLASAVKGIVGAIPVAGTIFAEFVGYVLPNQRLDRITRFLKDFDQRISKLEQESLRSLLVNEGFSDLFEESLRQASQSLTDDRRSYIASLLANSLKEQDIEYIEAKHLLRILAELNDIEIIWLRFYLYLAMGGDEKFRETHNKVLAPIRATMADPTIVVEKESLQTNYKEHLVRLGLLTHRYDIDNKTKMPIFDSFSGSQKVSGYKITNLGRLLLKYIGLSLDEEL